MMTGFDFTTISNHTSTCGTDCDANHRWDAYAARSGRQISRSTPYTSLHQALMNAAQAVHEKTHQPLDVLVVIVMNVERKLERQAKLQHLFSLLVDQIELMKACTTLIKKEVERFDDVRWLREWSWRRDLYSQHRSQNHRQARQAAQYARRARERRPTRLLRIGNGHRV